MPKHVKGFSLDKVKNKIIRRVLICLILPCIILIFSAWSISRTIYSAFLSIIDVLALQLSLFISGFVTLVIAAQKSWRIEK